MKFPSVSALIADLTKVLRNYPFEVFAALCGSCAATAFIELENNNAIASGWCVRIMMAANIALLLSLSASLFSKSKNLSGIRGTALSISAIIVSVLFLFAFDPVKRESDVVRFFLVSFGFHLLVAFSAFSSKNKINAFWQFNKAIFLRILAAALYSVVLYAGLSAALGAMNFLFNFNFEWDSFAIMGVWIAGMFQTLFFLAGIPELSRLEADHSYPKGLKLFTQYVLIPLATVYVVILLSYELKIIIEWNMPKGLVSSLILGYAVFGILSFLLIYPLRNQDGHKWIRNYSKTFFFLLLPLLILLYLAVYVRVGKYGITEGRYFLISLAIWLSFVTIYFIWSKKQNIIIIPLSLCIITLLAVYGPLSAFNIAEHSQVSRLEHYLAKSKLLKEGKLRRLDSLRDTADREEIQEITRYLLNKYGLESLQPVLKENLYKVSDSIKTGLLQKRKGRGTYSRWDRREKEQEWLLSRYNLSLDYINPIQWEYKQVVAENKELVPVYNADFMVDVSFYQDVNEQIKLSSGNSLRYHFDKSDLTVRINNDSLKLDFRNIYQRIEQNKANKKVSKNDQEDNEVIVPRQILTENFKLAGYGITFVINSIRYTISGKEAKLESIDGVFLLRR